MSAGDAPLARIADRFAGAFVLLTLALAGTAWVVAGDPVRAVAVLVVATPCPLLLAVPVAIVAGLSRAAQRGVIVKGGASLEQLARAKVLLLDKTGTLTAGRPVVRDVVSRHDAAPDDVLRLAASVDQFSAHVLAGAVIRGAEGRRLPLSMPTDLREVAGRGVRGTVDGQEVAVGKASWVSASGVDPWVADVRRRAAVDGSLTIFVGRDRVVIGALLLEDPLRLDARWTLRALRDRGLRRIVMVTGDRSEVGDAIGVAVGVDAVYAERSPGDKVDVVRLEAANGPAMMVGDGINDAAALAAADVGVALGARGASVASEAADVVITVDRLDRLGDAVGIAQRAFGVARQSAGVGMALAGVAMLVAAGGLLPPVWGAACQELIDVAVIANALRALRGGVARSAPPMAVALTERFSAEHRRLAGVLVDLRSAADALASGDRADGLARARAARTFLVDELLPHEWDEDRTLYPWLQRTQGGPEATAALSREHVEIAHLVRRLDRLLDLTAAGASDADVVELCGVLYGLLAILRLHFAQEDERYDREVGDQRDAASSASSSTKPRNVRVRG
jgi:cation transport ATPase